MNRQVKGIFANRISPSKFLTAAFLFVGLQLAYQNETVAAGENCSSIFTTYTDHLVNKVGGEILHERDSQLHTSTYIARITQRVKNTTGVTVQRPAEKIALGLAHMQKILAHVRAGSYSEKQLKSILHSLYLIKPEHVPEGYFENQRQMAYERGYGDQPLTQAQRQQHIEIIIKDQKITLDGWANFLLAKEIRDYPMWLKHWVLTGATKLSKFDPATGTFGSRSKETIAPFPEVNREAVARVADLVIQKLNKKSLAEIQDPELLKLLDGFNFGKLYGHVLKSMGVGQNGQFFSNDGHWVLYPRGSDHMPLVRSLDGHNTGWCTAGEATAQSHLNGGDFYVYYSKNRDGEFKDPRVAIRMDGSRIGEIRGVAKQQNLDTQLSATNIVKDKLKNFGQEGENYQRRSDNMALLTIIEKKQKANTALSSEELSFLYELERPILGFGQIRDPRIENILARRDTKSDIAQIFKVKSSEISFTKAELEQGQSKVHFGDLELDSVPSNLKIPQVIVGDFSIGESTLSHPLPRQIFGSLKLKYLKSAQGVILPEFVRSEIDLRSLKSAEGLELPQILQGDLILSGLQSAIGLRLPQEIRGSLYLSSLTSPEGLKLPLVIYKDLWLNRLPNLEGIDSSTVRGEIKLRKN